MISDEAARVLSLISAIDLTQVPGRSTCCGGLLWVPARGISKYWICGTCQQACDREPGPGENDQAAAPEQHRPAGTLTVS